MMSAFNPNSRQLTPQEWQNIATQSVDSNNSQFIIIGGIIAGLFVASGTGFLPSGVLVAAYSFYSAWQRTQKTNRNEIAINEYGCVAHVLKGQDFRDFRKQVGDEEVLKQVQWAVNNSYSPSTDALNFLEMQQKFSPKGLLFHPHSSLSLKDNPISNNPNGLLQSRSGFGMSAQSNEKNPMPPNQTHVVTFQQDIPDLAKKMAEVLKNSLIIGVPGVGKDYFVSNALEWVKKLHSNCTIFFIDPKDDPKETGYFQGRVDYLFRLNICTHDPVQVYEWVQRCFQSYDKFDAGTGLKLLIFNEMAATNKTLTNVKGALNWVKSKMVGYSSSGDSRGIKIWGISQNAHNSGIGFDGGEKSIFTPIVIVAENEISASEQVLRAHIIPNDKRLTSDEIKAICRQSPVKRAIFHGTYNQWFPMPELTNYSGYDRDSRTFISEQPTQVQTTQTQTQPKTQVDLMIYRLEISSQLTLEEFIENDLKAPYGSNKNQLKTAIIEMLHEARRTDLLNKFQATV
ncbi:hypothetical protein PN456_09395 [Nodularia spumigena CS-586/05]|uniref:hypothetical protein n=1 Tax=Nodularia spumigena TaxID=70799 RepID=UPI00232AD616|nr:hypothetical protein [Nodularia spumigena]MDB9369171.1 hypothetical protein [Nodularia spumigena CS-586/05]